MSATNTNLLDSAVLGLSKTKVASLREALNDESVHVEAAKTLSTLLTFIEGFTIYPGSVDEPQAEVVVEVADLVTLATNANNPHRVSDGGCCFIWLRGQDLNL